MRTTFAHFLVCIFVAMIGGGCAHHVFKGHAKGEGLYPYGTYRHKVKIEIPPPGSRKLELRGVVSSTPEKLIVIGLSNFGTTVFRIEEDLKTGDLKKEFYLEVLRQHEERFLGFYKLIKTLLTAAKGEPYFERDGAIFDLTEPDDHNIYRKIEITHPQVHIFVEVTDYAL